MATTARKLIQWVLLALAIMLVVAQFIPVDRTNPPIDPSQTFEARMQPPALVAAAIDRSCRDCHSNATTWPWYSRVAPASWLLAHDVKEGRSHMNFSEWGALDSRRAGRRLEEMCEEVRAGSMPERKYVLVHPDAKLSQAEIDAICDFAATVAKTLEQAPR